MTDTKRKLPQLTHTFRVTFAFTSGAGDSIAKEEAYFKSVSGLSSDIAVEDVNSGGGRNAMKLAGNVSYANVTLTRGFSGQSGLLDWHRSWALRQEVGKFGTKGTLEKATVTIEQLDPAMGATVMAWEFVDAWPCKWSGADFDTEKSEIHIETIELAHNGMTMKAEGKQ